MSKSSKDARMTRSLVRGTLANVLLLGATACLATEPLRLGAIEDEAPKSTDAGVLENTEPVPERLDAGSETELPDRSSFDAGGEPVESDDQRERDAGSAEEPRTRDAGALDAQAAIDAGTEHDAGAKDAAAYDAAGSLVNDAGPDAARSLLCTFEPWHCL